MNRLHSPPIALSPQLDMTNKLIYSIIIPWATIPVGFDTFKTMLRHVNSHAIVNAGTHQPARSDRANTSQYCLANTKITFFIPWEQKGFRIELDSSFRVTKQPTLAYGGAQKYPCRATKTEQMLVGRVWTDPTTLRGKSLSGWQFLLFLLTPPNVCHLLICLLCLARCAGITSGYIDPHDRPFRRPYSLQIVCCSYALLQIFPRSAAALCLETSVRFSCSALYVVFLDTHCALVAGLTILQSFAL